MLTQLFGPWKSRVSGPASGSMKLENVWPINRFFPCAYAWRRRGVVELEPKKSISRKNRIVRAISVGTRKSTLIRLGRTESVELLTLAGGVGMGMLAGIKRSWSPAGRGSNVRSVLA